MNQIKNNSISILKKKIQLLKKIMKSPNVNKKYTYIIMVKSRRMKFNKMKKSKKFKKINKMINKI